MLWHSIEGHSHAGLELSSKEAYAEYGQASGSIFARVGGIAAVTASSFIAAFEDPANFAKSRSVGAWIRLTTRCYQSGKVDYAGRISKRGDTHLRALLYEAAMVILTQTTADSICTSGV